MTGSSTALSRLMEQALAGTDVLVTGASIPTRRLMDEGALCLAEEARVIRIVWPVGELGLSHLIAQLSGRHDFEDQDDSVLELGFRRLAVPEQPGQRTVLMLQARHGIARSALRYLQHALQTAPDLTLVALGGPTLATMLDEPGFATLRVRLLAAPAVDLAEPAAAPAVNAPALNVPAVAASSIAASAPPPLLLTAPPMAASVLADPVRTGPAPGAAPLTAAPSARLAVPSRRRRSAVLWAASAAGLSAALALIAWVGHSSPAQRFLTARLEPATASAPPLAASSLPNVAGAVPPAEAVPPAAVAVVRPATALSARPDKPTLATLSPAGRATAIGSLPAEPATPQVAEDASASAASVADLPEPPVPPKADRAVRTARRLDQRPEQRPEQRQEQRPHDNPQMANRRTYWPPSYLREPEVARYDSERAEPPDDVSTPRWALRREVRRNNDGAYLGTYAADPYGVRVFRYDP